MYKKKLKKKHIYIIINRNISFKYSTKIKFNSFSFANKKTKYF